MSNVCVSGGIAPRSLNLATIWMRVISYTPLLICFRGKSLRRQLCDVLLGPQRRSGLCMTCCLILSAVPDFVWRAAWSSAPFRMLCDVLLGPQCRSGLCVTCCMVLSTVPDAVWRAAWSSVPFRTLCDVLLGPQCRSGLCVTCCLVLSAVPDAVWPAASS